MELYSTPPYIFMAWCLSNAYSFMAWYFVKHRDNFNFYLFYIHLKGRIFSALSKAISL
jgi:hypothetical protein